MVNVRRYKRRAHSRRKAAVISKRGGGLFSWIGRTAKKIGHGISKAVKKVSKVLHLKDISHFVAKVGKVIEPILEKAPLIGPAVKFAHKIGLNPLDFVGNIKKIVHAAEHPVDTLKKGYHMAKNGDFDDYVPGAMAKMHEMQQTAQSYLDKLPEQAKEHMGKIGDYARSKGIDPDEYGKHFQTFGNQLSGLANQMKDHGFDVTRQDVFDHLPVIMGAHAHINADNPQLRKLLELKMQNFSDAAAIGIAMNLPYSDYIDREVVQKCANEKQFNAACLAPALNPDKIRQDVGQKARDIVGL